MHGFAYHGRYIKKHRFFFLCSGRVPSLRACGFERPSGFVCCALAFVLDKRMLRRELRALIRIVLLKRVKVVKCN